MKRRRAQLARSPQQAKDAYVISFEHAAATLLAPLLGQDVGAVQSQIQRPPKPEMGNLGFPCFLLAKERRQAPPQIAADLAAQIPVSAPFSAIRAVGPYLNFVIETSALADASAGAALRAGSAWGTSASGAGQSVVIDYSSPNIAKPLGVHHIRSTMLGAALARLYAACGWEVVTVNHLGDWGTNFGQLMVSYKRAEAENPDVRVDIDALLKLYIQYHDAKDEDASLEDEAREWFRKLEAGDAEATRLWRIFVDESLKGLKALYARLGVSFDHYMGESFFNDKMEATVGRIEAKGLLTTSEGARVVEVDEEGVPPCLIRKRDGATTYATRDLAAAEYRQETFGFARCLYVVANQQELHFRQVFQVLGKMGYAWAAGCEHVKFGMLSFGAGVFGEGRTTGATRKGHVIFLEEVLDRAVAKARELIEGAVRDEAVQAEIDTLAEKVGVGAVIFTEFMQRRTKDVVFTWEKVLNLQGDSGPYLQYTHARLSSLLHKYEGTRPAVPDFSPLSTPFERDVLMALAAYPRHVERACAENEPSIVAEYLLELAAVFNRMYTDRDNHKMISGDEALTHARLGLVEAVRLTIQQGLALLGLAAPERM